VNAMLPAPTKVTVITLESVPLGLFSRKILHPDPDRLHNAEHFWMT
jgi:hypothetical protein